MSRPRTARGLRSAAVRGLVYAALCAVLLPGHLHAQSSDAGMAPQSSGVETGGAHAAVLDEQHRPITAGGFVKTGPIIFQNIAQQSGLATWHHTMGTIDKKYILGAVGSGVGLLDYNHDGWLDIYLVNGSTYDAETGKAKAPQAALFRNNHDGTFTNVAAQAGVTNDRWGYGVAIGDYDNDGWPDIYVSNYGKNRLYHNNHDGTFTDVAEKAGVTVGGWSTGATWGDYDGDGRLDLFVPGYVAFDMKQVAENATKSTYTGCNFRGVAVMCGPRGLVGEGDHLFHNNGDGTFSDVSTRAGVSDTNKYYGLASVFADVNNDGKVDLLVADDSTPNYLYLNKGNGTFDDESYASGYALNENGRETASMGIAIGDYRNNGLLDIYNTTFSDDYNPLYRDDGNANFTDVSYQMGIAEPTVPFLGWGDGFFDYDNDGWLDLLVVNGHVYPEVNRQPWGTTFAQRALLFHNEQGKHFTLMPAVEGTGLATLMPARGMAFGDLFNDGKIDAVVNNMDNIPSLFRNVDKNANHWITFHLIGTHLAPRDAIGTTVYVTAGALRQRQDVYAGGSFASSSDKRLHFGIGSASSVQDVEIHWANGPVEHIHPSKIDTIDTVVEGHGIVSGNYPETNAPSRAAETVHRATH